MHRATLVNDTVIHSVIQPNTRDNNGHNFELVIWETLFYATQLLNDEQKITLLVTGECINEI